jgi:hypothetical protein
VDESASNPNGNRPPSHPIALPPAGAAVYNGRGLLFRQTTRAGTTGMRQTVNVNPTCEHGLYLRLFVTNTGGW